MAEPAIEKRSVTLEPGCFKLREHEIQDWIAYAPESARLDDLKSPGFWALHAARMKAKDIINVYADDGSWRAECEVIQAGRNWAQVTILAVHKLAEPMKEDINSPLKIEYKGPKKLWCCIRKSDSAILRDGIETRVEADAWLRSHEKVMAVPT